MSTNKEDLFIPANSVYNVTDEEYLRRAFIFDSEPFIASQMLFSCLPRCKRGRTGEDEM